MPEKLSFSEQVKSFPGSFWVANLMEMLERLAYFSVRAVVGIFIVEAAARGGLELTHFQRGTIFTVWALIQTLLPMFTGAYSDRYGYRVSLYIAFTINFFAYILMGQANSYGSFFAAACMLATGTAIFKPPLHGTLAHSVEKKNSSVGWGFFYMLVNIGGFLGPFIAGLMRKMDWSYVFYAAAIITLLNFIPTIFLLKDLSKEVRKEKADTKGPFATFADGIMTLVRDARFMIFLLIFSGFWLMFMQLFDTLPIYIDEWVDSASILTLLSSIGIKNIADIHGNLPPEWMINLDAGAIVIFMLLVGYITGKFKPIVMMVVGMLISTVGLLISGCFISGWWVLGGIFVFAVGEMTCSPKFSEYIGLMAPPEKKAIYMGYSNIPFAIGWTFAGMLSGIFYAQYSDKFDFGRQYLANELGAKSIYVQYAKVVESSTEILGTAVIPADTLKNELETSPITMRNIVETRWDELSDVFLLYAQLKHKSGEIDTIVVSAAQGKNDTKVRKKDLHLMKGTKIGETWTVHFDKVYANYARTINPDDEPELISTGEVASEADTLLKDNPHGLRPDFAVVDIYVNKEEVLKDREMDKEYVQQGKALMKAGKKEEGRALMRKETGLKKIAVISVLQDRLNKNPKEITKILWDEYRPWRMWLIFGAIGLAATLAMLIYHFWLEADTKKRTKREGRETLIPNGRDNEA